MSISGAGIASLIQSTSSGSSGMFDAISGNAGTSSSASSVLSTLTPGSNGSIAGMLQQQKVTNQKNALFANIATRLDYMQQGKYNPNANWEKVASYAMQTGQPVAVTLDSKGAIQAAPQAQSDLSKYNPQQQAQLQKAFQDVAAMAGKIQANKTNQGLIDKLNGAEGDLNAVASGAVPAQASSPNNWEATGVELMREHHPFTISLDQQGNLMVKDQVTDPLTDVPATQQQALRTAIQNLPKQIATTTFTTLWQATAKTFDENNIPFHLAIDPITNQISTVENSGDNIIPEFLKTPPYASIGDTTPMLKQAASFIQSGKPFFLDFDPTGKIVAKEATAQNLIKYNTPANKSTALGTGSILSLFA